MTKERLNSEKAELTTTKEALNENKQSATSNMAKYQRERRAKLKEEHRCTYCGKQDYWTLRGKTACHNCMEKLTAKDRAYRAVKRAEKEARKLKEVEEKLREQEQAREQVLETAIDENCPVRIRYIIEVRRNPADMWSEWSVSDTVEGAEKHCEYARKYGLTARIRKKVTKIKTDREYGLKKDGDSKPKKARKADHLYIGEPPAERVEQIDLPDEILNNCYLDLAGAIIEQVCDEYKALLKKANNERVRQSEEFGEMDDVLFKTEQYFVSIDGEELTLHNGELVRGKCQSAVKKWCKRHKISYDDMILNYGDYKRTLKSMLEKAEETPEETPTDEG